MISNNFFDDVRYKLNSVGPGFCLAKWKQVTLHLHIGHNHSCHHPGTHKISEREIAEDPSALHNTRFKKERRKEMLEGKRPKECDYCWRVEDSSDAFSDRTFKSAEPWALPFYNQIKNLPWDANTLPSYVEVSFSNACNFKCSYCAPPFSTQWMEEIEEFGAYPTAGKFNGLEHFKLSDRMPIPQNQHNPYVEAFWKWWPELYKGLHTFRITGGEPFMHKDTFKVLDYILETPNPNKNLALSINSNLGVPDKIFNKAKEKLKEISDKGLVRELILFTSVDTHGAQAEYIRNGLVYNQWADRLDILLKEIPRLTIIIMSTYNALSVPNYKKLIHEVYDLKALYADENRYYQQSILLDSSYLRWPSHQHIKLLDNHWSKEIMEQAQLMDFYEFARVGAGCWGYSDVEIVKMKRIADYMKSVENEEAIKYDRQDFYRFFSEHDRRRGTDFCKTFPELEEFYYKCKELC